MSSELMAGDREAAGAIAGMQETYGTCGPLEVMQGRVDELRDLADILNEEPPTGSRRGGRKYGKKSETPAKVRRAIEMLSFIHGHAPSLTEISRVVGVSSTRCYTAALEEVRAGRLTHTAGVHRSWKVTAPEFQADRNSEAFPGVPMDVLVTDPSEVV